MDSIAARSSARFPLLKIEPANLDSICILKICAEFTIFSCLRVPSRRKLSLASTILRLEKHNAQIFIDKTFRYRYGVDNVNLASGS